MRTVKIAFAAALVPALLSAPSALGYTLVEIGSLSPAPVPWAGAEARTITLSRFAPGQNGAPLDAVLTGVWLGFQSSLSASLTYVCDDPFQADCTLAAGGSSPAYFLGRTTLSGAGVPVTELELAAGIFGPLTLASGQSFESGPVGDTAGTTLGGLDPSDFLGAGALTFTLESTGARNFLPGGGFGFDVFALLTDARLTLTYSYDSQTGPSPQQAPSVPAPAAAPLLAAGLGALALLRRRRRR